MRLFSTSRKFFDKELKKLHFTNAKAHLANSDKYSYIFDEISNQLVDRLLDIKRDFPMIAEVNSRSSKLQELLKSNDLIGMKNHVPVESDEIVYEDENKFDLVLSNLGLHWENDLQLTFKKINHILKPDGAFLASLYYGDTLFELRNSLMIAEQEREGGISVRTSPFLTAPDICNLLNGADFTLGTVDTLDIEIIYEDIFELADHLNKMGESNASLSRRHGISKDTLLSAASIYQQLFSSSDGNGIITRYQIGFLIGWKRHESQQQPKEAGSGKVNLTILSNKSKEI